MSNPRPLARDGLVSVFEYQCRAHKGERPQPEQFTFPAISFVREGLFGFRDDKRTRLLSRGFLLLSEPGRQYEVSHEHCGGDRCVIFRFEPRAFDELAGAPRRSSEHGYFRDLVLPPLPKVEALHVLAQRRIAQKSGTLGLEEVGLQLASEVLSVNARRPAKSSAIGSQQARDAVHAAIELLERDSTSDVRLDDVAQAAGLSAFHFLRTFKREVGVTPYRFLVQTRIRHAVRLLAETTIPVTDIAFDVGFGDLSNFINSFRREVGLSPRRFRDRMR